MAAPPGADKRLRGSRLFLKILRSRATQAYRRARAAGGCAAFSMPADAQRDP